MKSYPWAFLAFAILLVTYSQWKPLLMDRYTLGLVTDVKPSAGMDTGYIYSIAFPDQNGDVVNGYFYDYKNPEIFLHKKFWLNILGIFQISGIELMTPIPLKKTF